MNQETGKGCRIKYPNIKYGDYDQIIAWMKDEYSSSHDPYYETYANREETKGHTEPSQVKGWTRVPVTRKGYAKLERRLNKTFVFYFLRTPNDKDGVLKCGITSNLSQRLLSLGTCYNSIMLGTAEYIYVELTSDISPRIIELFMLFIAFINNKKVDSDGVQLMGERIMDCQSFVTQMIKILCDINSTSKEHFVDDGKTYYINNDPVHSGLIVRQGTYNIFYHPKYSEFRRNLGILGWQVSIVFFICTFD